MQQSPSSTLQQSGSPVAKRKYSLNSNNQNFKMHNSIVGGRKTILNTISPPSLKPSILSITNIEEPANEEMNLKSDHINFSLGLLLLIH